MYNEEQLLDHSYVNSSRDLDFIQLLASIVWKERE